MPGRGSVMKIVGMVLELVYVLCFKTIPELLRQQTEDDEDENRLF
ncbi:MAG: hypothetical protein SVU32_08865 [Candidatus Nanohaloarchaea archaeon]|nr:hypothetical protein [Candidatus Nanohaloarchaea archaeon]